MSDRQEQPSASAVGDETRVATSESKLPEEATLPPIVARMVVEIRSDGSRTVARGALEDLASGERVALQADASTPLMLASQLAKSLFKTPVFAKQAVRALLSSRKKQG